ncbi:MAG: sugar phosphate isomerase/epimerase, partial [Planctomycetales bacterium]|nr:sugar phosphate isomerase/epimerase [Planctomycetales bacterium]
RAILTTSLAASALTARRLLGATAQNGLGLQLWTVRNQLAADQDGTLKAIVDSGYEQVELMNVVDSIELAKAAQDRGLKIRSAFFNWETIANPSNKQAPSLERIIEVASDMKLEYLVFGYIGREFRDTADKLRKIADRANEAASKIRAAGMQTSYHNHSFEFERLGDKAGIEIFMERFDPQLIHFELDVFWAAIGGWDPVALLEKLGRRVNQVHLKDLKAGQGTVYDEGKVAADAFQEVGDGTIDMSAVISTAIGNGVLQFHVEQDQSPDPLASIRQSRDYLKGKL